MNSHDILVLLPFLLLAATALAVLLVIAFFRSHVLVFGLTLSGLSTALASLAVCETPTTTFLTLDRFAVFSIGLVIIFGLLLTLLEWDSQPSAAPPEERYFLLLVAVLGAAIFVASNHFALLLLGLKLLGLSFYTLVAFESGSPSRIKAALRYYVLGEAASALLLFGMALVYAATGTLQLVQALTRPASALTWAGFALIFVGIGFTFAVVISSLAWIVPLQTKAGKASTQTPQSQVKISTS
jgi:NADH-quinone oxidoreductase subunit N